MQRLTLERFAYTPMGTFGKIVVDGAVLYTVERPWLNNAPSVSCIPEGTYKCKPRRYFRGGYDAAEVTGVPNRSYILFHKGNTMMDSAGCILVCSSLGCLNGLWAGLGSKQAFAVFMDEYGGKEFELTITRKEAGVVTKNS